MHIVRTSLQSISHEINPNASNLANRFLSTETSHKHMEHLFELSSGFSGGQSTVLLIIHRLQICREDGWVTRHAARNQDIPVRRSLMTLGSAPQAPVLTGACAFPKLGNASMRWLSSIQDCCIKLWVRQHF